MPWRGSLAGLDAVLLEPAVERRPAHAQCLRRLGQVAAEVHEHMRRQRRRYRVVFVPDPVCWTEIPNSVRVLARQRNRWHRGLVQTLWAPALTVRPSTAVPVPLCGLSSWPSAKLALV